ncbi:MAG: hypothetical protein AAB414_04970, partial [Patescibacteria group bacterium]
GQSLTTGSGNIVLGYDADALPATVSNSLNIGNVLFGTGLGSGTGIATGNIGIGTSSPADELHIVGDIRTTACASDGAGDVACVDLAENYPVSEKVEAGDIVVISSQAGKQSLVEKSKKPYEGTLIGIISTRPAILIEEDKARFGAPDVAGVYEILENAPVALVGRVPTKVSLENGPIERGDYLTSSSTPGVAMKAIRPGPTVGKALEAFSCNSTSEESKPTSEVTGTGSSDGVCQGKIMAFVNVSYADPGNFFASLSFDNNGNLIIPKIKVGSLILDSSVASASASLVTSGTSLAYAPSDNSTLTTNPSTTLGTGYQLPTTNSNIFYDLSGKIASLEERIKQLEAQADTSEKNQAASDHTSEVDVSEDATTSAHLPGENEGTPSAHLEGVTELNLTPPDILLATSSAHLVASLDVSQGANILGLLTAYKAEIQDSFKVFGETTLGNTLIAGTLSVDGLLSVTGSSISSAGTLKLQSEPLAESLDILNGQVTVDKEGKLTVEKLAVSSKTLSSATIPAGQTSLVISTGQITHLSKIFITVHKPVLIAVTSKDPENKSFTVELAVAQPQAITFDWWIIESK